MSDEPTVTVQATEFLITAVPEHVKTAEPDWDMWAVWVLPVGGDQWIVSRTRNISGPSRLMQADGSWETPRSHEARDALAMPLADALTLAHAHAPDLTFQGVSVRDLIAAHPAPATGDPDEVTPGAADSTDDPNLGELDTAALTELAADGIALRGRVEGLRDEYRRISVTTRAQPYGKRAGLAADRLNAVLEGKPVIW